MQMCINQNEYKCIVHFMFDQNFLLFLRKFRATPDSFCRKKYVYIQEVQNSYNHTIKRLSFSNLSSQPLLSDKNTRKKVEQEHFQSLSSWSTASQKNISPRTKRAQHKMLRALLCFRVEGYFPLNIGPAKYNKLTTAEEERLMFQTTDNKNRKCHRNDLPDKIGSLLLR